MTFEQWWESYDFYSLDLMDDYEDHLAEYKIRKMCQEAFETGLEVGYERDDR